MTTLAVAPLLPMLPAPAAEPAPAKPIVTITMPQIDVNRMIGYLEGVGRSDLADTLQSNSHQDPGEFGRYDYLVGFATGADFVALHNALDASGEKGEKYARELMRRYGQATHGDGIPGGLALYI